VCPQNRKNHHSKKNLKERNYETKLVLGVILAATTLFTACHSAEKASADAAIKGAQAAYAVVAIRPTSTCPISPRKFRRPSNPPRTPTTKAITLRLLRPPSPCRQSAGPWKATDTKKAELTAKWTELSSTIPGLLKEVQKKADALTKSHKLPKGADGSLAAAKQAWTDASAAFTSGQLPDAVAKASAAKLRSSTCNPRLGSNPSNPRRNLAARRRQECPLSG